MLCNLSQPSADDNIVSTINQQLMCGVNGVTGVSYTPPILLVGRTVILLPRDAMHSAVLVIVILSLRLATMLIFAAICMIVGFSSADKPMNLRQFA